MSDPSRSFKIGLLALGVIHLLYFAVAKSTDIAEITGVLYPKGDPVGGDFVNLWAAARLVILDRVADIYRVGQFMAFQQTLTGAYIDLRMWAYPPHSLLLAWPFGLAGYYAAFAIWSVIGLAVLAAGARRFGFDRLEIGILLFSPATVLNLYLGQTGSLAAGLLLLSLSARSGRDPLSIVAGALLTMKPQAGFLLPLLWAFQRRWQLMAWTAVATIGLVGLAVIVFGLGPWRDYAGDTLPILSELERNGSGAFMTIIPSMFMTVRILTGDPAIALVAHAVFAVAVGVVVAVRLWRVEDRERQAAMVLIATVLMTPYIHSYDLALLLCGALLVLRRWSANQKSRIELPVMIAWALPQLVIVLNTVGVPISPLLILPLLLLA